MKIKAWHSGNLDNGIHAGHLYFTNDRKTAEYYGAETENAKTYLCELTFENPKIYKTGSAYDRYMERMTDWNELLNKGYDAIICEEEPKYYVALNPEKQVKILEVHDMNEDVTSLDRFKYEKNISVFIYDLLNLGKQVNPSNPYDWVADKMEEMSKWNKKDWEYLFKKELSFQDIRGAQTTFEKISQEIKKLADSYEESKRFGKLQENLEELKDGIYATQSAYDILNLFKNKPKAYRVVYDKNNHYYFIGDALKYIHGDLISAAYDMGFYYDELKNNSRSEVMIYLGNCLEYQEVLMLSFFPNGFGDIKAIDNERSSDWYSHKYVYEFGTVYTQEACPLEKFDFYQLLGEPLEQEELELPESLNERFEEIESGIYATQSAYDLINWMKNKPKAYRVVYDENIRYYFIADAYSYIHQDILESAYRSGFYPEMFSEDEIRDYIDDGMNLDMINKKPFLLFFAFSPNSDKNLDLEKSSDGYTRKYTYDFGSIYAHELTPLEDFDLYQLLKEPISKETIYENIYAKLCEDLSKFL